MWLSTRSLTPQPPPIHTVGKNWPRIVPRTSPLKSNAFQQCSGTNELNSLIYPKMNPALNRVSKKLTEGGRLKQ